MTVVISALATVSRLGTGRPGPGDHDRPALTPDELTPNDEAPGGLTALVHGIEGDPDFAGDKKVRLIEGSAALAVGTIAKLLAQHDLAEVPPSRRGLVLGTAMASLPSFMEISRTSLSAAKPYFVDHHRVPAALMNYTSGQAAIRFRLQGPNVTVTSGRASGVAALNYARVLVETDRAQAIICGAFEEVTPRRLRIERAAGRLTALTPPGEGCSVFLVETAEAAAAAGRPVLAELLAAGTALFAEDGGDAAAALVKVARRALKRAGVSAEEIGTVVRGPGGGLDADPEADAITHLAPNARVLDPTTQIGDTYGAAGAFGVAAALTAGDTADDTAGITLITSVDPDGQVAAAVLRPVRNAAAPRAAADPAA